MSPATTREARRAESNPPSHLQLPCLHEAVPDAFCAGIGIAIAIAIGIGISTGTRQGGPIELRNVLVGGGAAGNLSVFGLPSAIFLPPYVSAYPAPRKPAQNPVRAKNDESRNIGGAEIWDPGCEGRELSSEF
jgi:hypothetical protein